MKIQTILLADRLGKELSPLNHYACPAMLEVAGRKVIEYSLEDLAASEIKEALIVSAHTEQIENFAGDGSRWGLKLSYLLSRGEQSPGEILRRVDYAYPVLIVRGDVVRGPAISEFLDTAVRKDFESVSATRNGRDAGLCLVRQRWVHGANWPAVQLRFATLEIGDVGYHPLDSLDDFHAAAMAVAEDRLKGLVLPGRAGGPGLVAARLSRVDAGSVSSGTLFVGRGARVNRAAQTSGTVVVGEHALIDEGALLEDTVIMPNSYVGKNVELRQAIVAGKHLIRVDTEAITTVADHFLIGPMSSPAAREQAQSTSERVFGALLFVVSLPLWPVAALLALASNPRSPLLTNRLISNRSSGNQSELFTAVQWNTPVPILRNLPLLFAVISGHLRLVGVRPCAAEESHSGNTETPAGLLGPAVTDVSVNAPEEEIILGESLFIHSNGRLKRTTYLLKGMAALAGRRAWLPATSGLQFDRE